MSIQQFSVHDLNDKHVGFLVLLANELPDDEPKQSAQSGQIVLKFLNPISNPISEQSEQLELFWKLEKERVILFDNPDNSDNPNEPTQIGFIRQEILNLNGKQFLLNDLTGTF